MSTRSKTSPMRGGGLPTMKGLSGEEELGVWPNMEPPEHLTPEQKVIFQQLWITSRDKSSGFDAAAIEALSTNPEVLIKYTKAHRELTIKKIAGYMSGGSDQFLGLQLEIMKTILAVTPTDMRCILGTAQAIKTSGIQLDDDELKAAIDLAKVMHVMEEGEAQDGHLEDANAKAAEANLWAEADLWVKTGRGIV